MPEPMTPERLAEIRQRLTGATDGPWIVDEPQRTKAGTLLYVIHSASTEEDVAGVELDGDAAVWSHHRTAAEEDAAFIAHARSDVPALLDEVDRLRTKLERLRAARDEYRAANTRMQELIVKRAADAERATIRQGSAEAERDAARAEAELLRAERDRAEAKRDRLAEQVQRVRALHEPITGLPGIDGAVCRHCLTYDGQTVPAPCPTIRALDGTEATP